MVSPPDGPDGLCLAFEDINNVDGLSAFLKEMKEKVQAEVYRALIYTEPYASQVNI